MNRRDAMSHRERKAAAEIRLDKKTETKTFLSERQNRGGSVNTDYEDEDEHEEEKICAGYEAFER